jgi:hypothetical protein
VTLPAITLGYWAILYGVYAHVGKLTGPGGPVAPPDEDRPGYDLLKQVLQNPGW